jgi:peptidoglycan hydrolase CwlO-like protein
VPNPNKDFILKQKQAKIDQMRKKMKENKAKMGALNQNIGKLQNDCLILKNMYAMAALDT